MIVGLGTDIIGLDRIAATFKRQGQRFLDRVYTPAEQQYILAKPDPTERLASRWAAKEACMKALGTGWAKGVQFSHIALLPGAHDGPPQLILTDEAQRVAERLGAVRFHCSVSHSNNLAIATVILETL
jgi:holo-[acyl-carrier protein] synthase